ncbi:MAG TPA: RNA polymerase sigma factor [Rhizomicrobium sp.]
MLYREHAGALMRFLRGVLKSAEDAEDVTQEALLRLWRLPDWSAVVRPRTLLFTTAYRIAIDRLRRRKLERALFVAGVPDDGIVANEPGSERAIIGRQTLSTVVVAMEKLKPLRRDILLMSRLDGLSYGEIARETGLTADSIEKHVSRALAECRQQVAERESAPARRAA